MTEFLSSNTWMLWAIISLVCLGMELCTGGFYIICLAFGAIATIITSFFNVPILYQVIMFCVFSIACLFLVRPALKKMEESRRAKEGENGPGRKSNADAVVGKNGYVTDAIEENGFGWVQVYGDAWKATGANGEPIEKGAKITVTERQSLVVKVKKID